MVDRAHAILNAEQQNMQKRIRDCDGCHDPKSPPVFSMLVEVSTAGSGAASKSMFMICRRCAARPIQLFLHGKGYCAPGVRVDEPTALGKADLDRPTGESGHRVVVEDTVEPPVEIIDKRYEDEEEDDEEDDEDDDSEPPPPPPPKKRKRARARPEPPPSPPALALCAACGHQRAFHPNGGQCRYSQGRGCEANCRGFREP